MRWGLFEGAALKGSSTGRMYLWVGEGAGFLQCFKWKRLTFEKCLLKHASLLYLRNFWSLFYWEIVSFKVVQAKEANDKINHDNSWFLVPPALPYSPGFHKVFQMSCTVWSLGNELIYTKIHAFLLWMAFSYFSHVGCALGTLVCPKVRCGKGSIDFEIHFLCFEIKVCL